MKVPVDGKLAEYSSIKRQNGVVIPLVSAHLLKRGDDSNRNPRVVHPSEMAAADWCERATYYRIVAGEWPDSGKFNFTLQNIFAEGNAIHSKWQNWMAETGKLWGDWECRICGKLAKSQLKPKEDGCAVLIVPHIWEYKEVSLQHGLISGHEDGALIGDYCLVEVKSIGLGTLRHENPALLAKHYVETKDGKKLYDLDAVWNGLRRPLPNHLRQANVYLHLVKMMGLPFDRCSILYEYKVNQVCKEYVVGLSSKIIDPLLERVEMIHEAIDANYPPSCPNGGCSKCAYYDKIEDQGRVIPELAALIKERNAKGATSAHRVPRKYTSR